MTPMGHVHVCAMMKRLMAPDLILIRLGGGNQNAGRDGTKQTQNQNKPKKGRDPDGEGKTNNEQRTHWNSEP